MNTSIKQLREYIPMLTEKLGWNVWFTYSDKLKDGTKRVKYAANGWEPKEALKAKIQKEIEAKISKFDNVVSMGWKQGMSIHGSYPYFYINVKDVTKEPDPAFQKEIETEIGKKVDAIFKKPLVVWIDSWQSSKGENIRYVLSTSKPLITMKDDVEFTKLSPKNAEAVKEAIGPKRLKNILEYGGTEIPKIVYEKLMKLQ